MTDPSVHAVKGDERIRTAVCDGANDPLYERPLTRDQQRALRYMEANGGTATEGALFLEGLNRPRHTLRSLARRGLVVRVQWWDEEWGDEYDLARAALASPEARKEDA